MSTTAMQLTLGTRGSRLALAQAEAVAQALVRACPGLAVRVQTVVTEGDRITSGPLPSWGSGVFVREIERALLQGEIDLAVHSLKDLPARLPEGLALLAVPERADPHDVLVSTAGHDLAALPPGARVGTSSLRRAAFLRALRPDLTIAPIRGNIDTRWRKLLTPELGYDALVLAAAGIERLGLDAVPRVPIPLDVLLPAPGQGALAIEGRAGDQRVAALARRINHAPTAAAVAAERCLLRELEGGCRVPVAALAVVEGDAGLWLRAAAAAPDGSRVVRAEGRAPLAGLHEAEALGAAVAAELLARGAAQLLREGAGAASMAEVRA